MEKAIYPRVTARSAFETQRIQFFVYSLKIIFKQPEIDNNLVATRITATLSMLFYCRVHVPKNNEPMFQQTISSTFSKNHKRTAFQALAASLIFLGSIALTCVIFRFEGLIEIQLRMDGAKILIDGRPSISSKTEAQH